MTTERMLFWSAIGLAAWTLFCIAGIASMVYDMATAATPRWKDHALNGALMATSTAILLGLRSFQIWKVPAAVLRAAHAILLTAGALLLAAYAWLTYPW